MKFRKSKKDKDINAGRRNSQEASGQKVYTYYTASKKQLDQFERTNDSRQAKQAINPDSLKAKAFKAFSVIAILFAVGFTLTITSEPKISIDGTVYNSEEYYSSQISNVVSQGLNNRFKPTINSADIEGEVYRAVTEADMVKVSVSPIGRGVKVNITTQEPFAILIQDGAPSYIVDESGKVIADVSKTELDTDMLSTIKNESGLNYKLGDQLFKPLEMQAVKSLDYQYTYGDDNKVINYILPENLRELDVKTDSYVVRYSLDDSSGADTTQQYGAYIAIKKQLDKQGSAPRSYIDVRLADKVFVK